MEPLSVPYALRLPQTDDLHALREELSLQTELYGRRSNEAQAAFENLFRTSCRLGRPLDALSRYSPVETERFFAQTREGTAGHVYWLGAKNGFTRNDGKTRRAPRWWWEHLHGPILATTDVIADCGQRACINPAHQVTGRAIRRRYYTDDQMCGALQAYALKNGRPPTSRQWRDANGRPTPAIYRQRFGSWVDALKSAGLLNGYNYNPAHQKATPERARASLQEARRFLGHIPGYEEFRSKPVRKHLQGLELLTSPNPIKKQIGPSWQDAIRNTFGGT